MSEKQRYQRILHLGEEDDVGDRDEIDVRNDDDDNNSTEGARSLDGASGVRQVNRSSPFRSNNNNNKNKTKQQRHMPKRRGSHGSLASYRSLASADDEDFGNGEGFLASLEIAQSHSNDTTYEDAIQGQDDLMNDETAPFRGSFDQDEQNHDQPMSKQSPPLVTAGNNHQSMSPAPNTVISYPSSLAYSGSFDLDDDDDDDEALRRYNIDFSRNQDTNMMTSLSHHGSSVSGNDNLHSQTRDNQNGGGSPQSQSLPYHESSRSFSFIRYLWYSFQSVRQQARQRRAQRLLQQSERSFRQTLWICVMTYCDATDRGILLVASLMLAWSILVYNVSSQVIRGWLVITGIFLLVIRFGARPFSEYLQRSRSRRRRLKELQENQQQLHLDQQQHQEHHFREKKQGHRHQHQHLRLRNDSDDIGAVTPPGRYLDQPMPTGNGSGSNDLLFIDTTSSSDNFELKSIGRRGAQNDLGPEPTGINNDPAIHTV